MIIGIGLDIVEIPRIARAWERFGPRFAEKILHPSELAAPRAMTPQFLASRFAAKEAAVKALGTGFSAGIGPTDIAVVAGPGGKPELVLHGKALERLRGMGAARSLLSITHGKETAAAVVILEA